MQGRYFLEDPTGSVELDLSEAVNNCRSMSLLYLKRLFVRFFMLGFLLRTVLYWQKVETLMFNWIHG